MAAKSEFVTYLLELLEPLGHVSAKALFGGFGIYRDSLMFGLVANDTLYLKVDDKTRADFETKGLSPFTYSRKGKEYSLSYYQAPSEALENPEEIQAWAQKAYDAALRAAQSKPRKKRGKRRGDRSRGSAHV
jgi:DNA transformation protein